MRISDYVARYGGDEFVLILPTTSSEEAEVVLQRLTIILGKAHFSYGIVTYPQDGEE